MPDHLDIALGQIQDIVNVNRAKRRKHPLGCICIEDDWPEYPAVLKMLSERVDGVKFIPSKSKHSHYYKDVKYLETLDVYRILKLFNVSDPCIQHALKKLLVAGGRGAGKDISQDLDEAIDSIKRALEMIKEDETS